MEETIDFGAGQDYIGVVCLADVLPQAPLPDCHGLHAALAGKAEEGIPWKQSLLPGTRDDDLPHALAAQALCLPWARMPV